MLKARIVYQSDAAQERLQPLLTAAMEQLLTLEWREAVHELGISFSERLTYNQYTAIHQFLLTAAKALEGRIHDKGAMLGYLMDSTPAYIVTNWDAWSRMLHEKKLHSAKGEYVHIYKEGELLESGILLEYEFSPANTPFALVSCTLITSEGEQTVYGDHLTLEAEQRF
ncbi:hypothetical protein [Ectobacillus ponti]|uniref:Uncharacterized protein n=1 Tax=Ectobacillus ponti TaxID=2961894 RepID=A0AA42BN35_9BACI|nr:hypothetical protein [Ectobacillus ponti]MCP8967540.1 hypothetical protein [Ectobacillus ponti]